VLIHDAQHRAAEFPGVGYLGHASAEYAVALGREAGARAVVLFHHAPGRSDDEVDAMLRSVQHPGLVVLAAHEGLVMDLAEVGQEGPPSALLT
jgi:ribonuclease BN (tRNA processing enzyme)